MKKIAIIILLFYAARGTAQYAPVNNLTWEQEYDFGHYNYALGWAGPEQPHDNLIGYKIYRDNILYRFQADAGMTNMGPNPNGSQDFMNFDSGGDGFEVHVTAIYSGGLESDFTETVFVQNNLLQLASFDKEPCRFHPNPTNGVIYIVDPEVRSIHMYDLTGKLISSYPAQPVINITAVAGVYVLKLIFDDKMVDEKIVLR